MAKKRILIIGPIAPPFGGVSVHISRLAELLKNDFEFDFVDESRTKKTEYFNLRSFNLLKYLKKVKNTDLIYINSGTSNLRIFHLLSAKFFAKKTILTIHSFPKTNKLLNAFISNFYRLSNKVILVNEHLNRNLILPKNKTVIREAFIPPSIENETSLPGYISDWLSEKKKKGEIVICANASRLEMSNNEDVYGLDLCISICERLNKKKIPANFIFVVSSMDKNEEKFLEYKEQIKKSNLTEIFLLVNEKLSFVKLIQMSDVVVRGTNTDGDALTVREALFLKKPVIASDVVKRPEGVILFKNRSIDDLESKLEKLALKKNGQEFDYKDFGQLNETSQFYINLIETVLLNKNCRKA